VVAVCVVVLLAFLAIDAARTHDGKSSRTERTAQAKAKAKATRARRARAAALQRRRIAQRRAAQRAAALRRLQAQRPVVTVPPVTVPRLAPATPAADLAAVERSFTALNAAFHKGVAAGIVQSIAANYWVAAGEYTAAQCTRFEANRGGGVVAEAFAIQPTTFRADPGWVDPAVGKAPTGRVYSFTVDDTQTLVSTGETRRQSGVMHASVNPAGIAHLFFRCS
jgi:hypothetical protein